VARTVACPRCSSQLRVAADAGRWLTCPRCLASVGNPDVFHLPTEPPAEPALRTEPEPREATDTCPGCGRDVSPLWRHCPFCSAALGGRRELPRMRPAPDDDVRPDSKGTAVGLAILGSLGFVGVFLLLWVGSAPATYADLSWVLYLAVGVVVLVAGGCGVLVYLGRGGPASSAPLGVGAATITIVTTGVLLLLVLSACVTFVFTCGRGLRASTTAAGKKSP
jgi:hypothetical protein